MASCFFDHFIKIFVFVKMIVYLWGIGCNGLLSFKIKRMKKKNGQINLKEGYLNKIKRIGHYHGLAFLNKKGVIKAVILIVDHLIDQCFDGRKMRWVPPMPQIPSLTSKERTPEVIFPPSTKNKIAAICGAAQMEQRIAAISRASQTEQQEGYFGVDEFVNYAIDYYIEYALDTFYPVDITGKLYKKIPL